MKQRKIFSPEQKALILRELLENGVSASKLAEQYEINVNDILRWKKQLFEAAPAALSRKNKKQSSPYETKYRLLEEKLKRKDEVIALIAQENIELKKNIDGEL